MRSYHVTDFNEKNRDYDFAQNIISQKSARNMFSFDGKRSEWLMSLTHIQFLFELQISFRDNLHNLLTKMTTNLLSMSPLISTTVMNYDVILLILLMLSRDQDFYFHYYHVVCFFQLVKSVLFDGSTFNYHSLKSPPYKTYPY